MFVLQLSVGCLHETVNISTETKSNPRTDPDRKIPNNKQYTVPSVVMFRCYLQIMAVFPTDWSPRNTCETERAFTIQTTADFIAFLVMFPQKLSTHQLVFSQM